MMFLASCIGAALLVAYGTVNEELRLRRILAPDSLSEAIERTVNAAVPLDVIAAYPKSWCIESLRVLSDRVLSQVLADRAGDRNANSFYQSVKAGRFSVSLKAPGTPGCSFSSEEVEVLPELRQEIEANLHRASTAVSNKIIEKTDGWISVASLAPAGEEGPHLVAGIYLLSPFAKLAQRGSVFGPLAIFIFCTNIVTALVLVSLLIRRIRRANVVSGAWTLGNLAVRIDDPGRDEFSRLTHKFDQMADALSDLIETKQALAASEERNRLARDLHDSAKQRAFALNLQLTAAQRTMASETKEGKLIGAALLLANQLQQDLAGVVRPLLEPTIIQAGFRKVLSDGVERLLSGSSIEWSLSIDAEEDAMLTERPELARQLLLITIEAVANALKHSSCKTCVIKGTRRDEFFSWVISDDGCGMSLANQAKTQGMGLASMKIRATDLPQGTLDILSRVGAARTGAGTSINVTFKLEKP